MSATAFRKRLQSGKPILADGAMGTMLHRRVACPRRCLLRRHEPGLARLSCATLHRAYIDAGAELIATNTFGANRFKLAAAGQAGRLAQINQRGVELARQASLRQIGNGTVFVAGSVGPLGVGRRALWIAVSQAEARDMPFRRAADGALLEAGVDLIQFETFREHRELLLAVAALRELSPSSAGHRASYFLSRASELRRSSACAGGYRLAAGRAWMSSA